MPSLENVNSEIKKRGSFDFKMTDTSFVTNSTFAAFEDIIHHTQNENIVLRNNLSLSNFTYSKTKPVEYNKIKTLTGQSQ